MLWMLGLQKRSVQFPLLKQIIDELYYIEKPSEKAYSQNEDVTL